MSMSVSVQFQDAGIRHELCWDSIFPGSGKYVLHNVVTCTYVNEIYFSSVKQVGKLDLKFLKFFF